MLNTHLRDQLNETAPAKFTTKGDGFFATGANAGARVPISGSNGGVLIQNSACNAGVSFDGRFVISASVPTVTSASNAILALNTTSAANKRAGLELRSGGTNQYIVGVDFNSNNNKNYFIYDSIDDEARIMITASGQVMIGTSTCNANMATAGLTINQGANDDEILALKSSDIAHGMTAVTETDTFLYIDKLTGTGGGAHIVALDDANQVALNIVGIAGGTGDTSRSVTANAPASIGGAKKSGTTFTAMGANENVLVIRNSYSDSAAVQFIFDSDGDFHANAAVNASAYDAYDDAAMCRAFDLHVSNPNTVIRNEFDEFIQYQPADLERAKLVAFNPDGQHFWNITQFVRLHNGAIGQLYTELQRVKQELKTLTGKPGDNQLPASTSGPPSPDS